MRTDVLVNSLNHPGHFIDRASIDRRQTFQTLLCLGQILIVIDKKGLGNNTGGLGITQQVAASIFARLGLYPPVGQTEEINQTSLEDFGNRLAYFIPVIIEHFGPRGPAIKGVAMQTEHKMGLWGVNIGW